MKRFNIYISFALPDEDNAEELKKFLVMNGLNVSCDLKPQQAGPDNKTRLWAIKSIRSCDLFVLLLSRQSLSTAGGLLKGLRYDSAEALSFHRTRLLLFIEDMRTFPPLFIQNLLRVATKTHAIQAESGNTGINYHRLSEVLKEIGYPLIQGSCASSGEHTQLATIGRRYDVFLSYKSEDYDYAKIVRDLLVSRGLNVFLSKTSLPQMGKDEYREQIDVAIEGSRHMVIVASKAAHVNSEWVKYEWGLFLGEKLARRKEGNLVTVVAGELRAADLPISLRNREAIALSPEEISRLLEYLK